MNSKAFLISVPNLPPNLVTIEIIENINPSEDFICACKKLKLQGYALALDDFVYDNKHIELIKLVDIIKVDTISKEFNIVSSEITDIYCEVLRWLKKHIGYN